METGNQTVPADPAGLQQIVFGHIEPGDLVVEHCNPNNWYWAEPGMFGIKLHNGYPIGVPYLPRQSRIYRYIPVPHNERIT